MGPHFVQNSSLFPHLLVGMVAPARLAWHTHRDPGEKKGGEREGKKEGGEWKGGVRARRSEERGRGE